MKICFGKNNGFKSRLIRWLTKGEWSHSWIEISKNLIQHCTVGGVQIEYRENIDNEYHYQDKYEIKNYDEVLSNIFLHETLISKYDYFSAIWNGFLLVLYNLFHWKFLFKLTRIDEKKYTCSEYVADFLFHLKLYNSNNLELEFITPQFLYEICLKSRNFEKAE